MIIHYRKDKAYPYQVCKFGEPNNVIGIGKTKEEAWEAAALNLNNTLFELQESISKALQDSK